MRIGAATICAERGAKKQNLEKILSFAEKAAKDGCSLVVFPEYSVDGPWLSYDPGAELDDLIRVAEPLPGQTSGYLAEHAKRLNIVFCVGMYEKGMAAKPFNTQVVIGPSGIIHKQRKLQPTVGEVGFCRGGGDTASVFTLNAHCFGIIICADNRFKAIHDSLHQQGARIFLAPHAGAIKKFERPGTSWDELVMWHRENRLGRYGDIARRLGVTNVYVDMKDPRESFDDKPEWEHYLSGITAVFGPNGDLLIENNGNEESLIVVEV